MLRQIRVSLDCPDVSLYAYTYGERWNGFACPMFTRAEADRLVAAWNANTFVTKLQGYARYDEATDTYHFPTQPDCPADDPEGWDSFAGEPVEELHLYPIGSHCWTWWNDPPTA